MLSLVIAEAALELVPEELRGHPSVRNDAQRRRIEPGDILLDRSFHHAAMLRLKDGFRRGRPDLVHLTLLSVTSTPLHQEGRARVYIHTIDDVVLEFAVGARPPKTYLRFGSLVEKLLAERTSEGGVVAVREKTTLPQLLKEVHGGGPVIGLSVQGESSSFESLAAELTRSEDAAVVLGGFPKGHFFPRDLRAFDSLVRVHDRPLDAHVVAARVVYEAEKSLLKKNSQR